MFLCTSRRLRRGDVLLTVNGQPVAPSNVDDLLRGNDLPGSTTRLSFRRIETMEIEHVTLTRMPSGVLGDSLYPSFLSLLL